MVLNRASDGEAAGFRSGVAVWTRLQEMLEHGVQRRPLRRHVTLDMFLFQLVVLIAVDG